MAGGSPGWTFALAVGLLSGFSAGTASALRSEEGLDLLRVPPAQVRQGQAPAARTVRQTAALASAGPLGVEVVWDESKAVPTHIRGTDLGRKQALAGGKGLRVKGQKAYEEDAVAVLDDLAGLYGIREAAKEFAVRKNQPDALGHRHIRLTQKCGGLRVVGAELIVHFDAEGRIYEVNGQYKPDVAVALVPAVKSARAVRIAQDNLTGMGYPKGAPAKEPELVVYARDIEPCLAYEVVLRSRDAATGIPGRWRYWIGARQGEILMRYNDIKRVDPPTDNGQAATVSGNRLEREDGAVVSVEGWYENTGLYYLHNPVQLWCVSNASEYAFFGYPDTGTYASRATDDWGSSDPTEISAAYNVNVIQQYYQQVHGRNSYDDNGGIANAYVHVGLFYNNAFWDGSAMHIGDGDGVGAESLAVLDIFAHEYMHAVTEHTCDLVYANESGALNESFSDIFGACIEFYGQADDRTNYPASTPGRADWLIGEDSWLSSPALRDMRNPANTATVGAGNEQPTRYKGSYWYSGTADDGGVHQNSGVQNYFFYLLCEGGSGTNDSAAYGFDVRGIGIQNAEQVAYRALSAYCTPETTYSKIKGAWASAARDLDARWVRPVNSAWNAVLGLAPPPPTAILSPSQLPAGRVGSWYSYNLVAGYGVPAYTWEFLPGATKPDWLNISAGGELSGLPLQDAVGTNSFTVTVTDAAGEVATNQFSLVIRAPFVIPYEQTFENGGQDPDSWTQTMLAKNQPWVFVNGSPYTHPESAYAGSYCARLAVLEQSLTNSVTRLESPMIDFGTGYRAGRLTFWHYMANWEGAQDYLRVYYKTSYYGEWQLLASYVAATENWTQRSVDLPDLTGTYYLAFEGTANYGYGIHIDNVRIFDPTLPLAITDPAQLPDAYTERPYRYALTAAGGAGAFTFDLVAGALPTGMVLTADGVISGTVATAQSAVFTVRVTDSVAPFASATAEFRLDVELPVASLFEEDFEHYGSLPAGWTQEYVERSVNWACRNGGGNETQYNQPDHAHGGGYNAVLFYTTTDTFALNDNHKTRLVTPPINLGAAPAGIRLVFWHCMTRFDDGQDELRVYYKTSATAPWNLLASYTENVPDWTKRTLPLPNPTGTYYLAFEGNARFGHGVCIDDILIHDGASAPVITTPSPLPNGLKGFAYSQTLTASGGVEPYTWAVVSNALPGGLELSTNGVISGSTAIEGTAVFLVRVAGADGYASTNQFRLTINPTQSGPFAETFDAGTGMPAGWTQEFTIGTFGWTFRKGSPENLPAAAHSPQSNACFYANGAISGQTKLVSPMLNLGVGTTNAVLTFWEYRAAYYGECDRLRVYYKTSASGAWTSLAYFTASAGAWTQRTLALPNTTSTYYIAFEGEAHGGYGIGLDDVGITGDFVTTYNAWMSTNFSTEELADEGISGSTADPDGDGVANGLEYAMGLDPWASDTEGLPFGGVTAGYLTLSFRMDKIALQAGTDYVVESCTNLVNAVWTTNDISEVARADSNTWWQSVYRHDVPVTNAPQRFLRLKVYLP